VKLMTVMDTGNELINLAIAIERRGITFYDIMAKSTDDEMARAVFEALVEMERQHIAIFEDMMGEGVTAEPETGPEAWAYLKSLIDDAVFTDDMITSEMATQADSDIKALELAISAEKDSILFYYEMSDLMPQKVLTLIRRIINEEKSHLRQLTEVKRKIQNK
jgi:rubrerythrin